MKTLCFGALGLNLAAGVLSSANVRRPSASSFISLRRAHPRRDPAAQCGSISSQHTASPVPRALGGPRSEVKEEAKPGDMSGGDYPVASARANERAKTQRHQEQ